MDYYNEIDPYCVAWLRNLIAENLLPGGVVDDRDIREVMANDLRGFQNCHFFAGLGGWPYALRLAQWPTERPVWTGSCPCQPFSSAGAGKTANDERHLWPSWFPLIAECRPPIVFGEQVEAAISFGWLDVVFSQLESKSYACGAAVLPACSLDAKHIRQRLWFVADHDGARQPNLERFAAAKKSKEKWIGFGLDHSENVERFRWPAEPAVGRVVHGLPPTMDQLRAFGNAIVPQIAAQFIRASMR